MKKYIDEVDSYIDEKKYNSIDEFINNHLTKISFFQHERLIHLLVTLCYAFFTLIFWALLIVSFIFLPIALAVTVFLIFYIRHYFFLENGVQYMYKQYDKLKELKND